MKTSFCIIFIFLQLACFGQSDPCPECCDITKEEFIGKMKAIPGTYEDWKKGNTLMITGYSIVGVGLGTGVYNLIKNGRDNQNGILAGITLGSIFVAAPFAYFGNKKKKRSQQKFFQRYCPEMEIGFQENGFGLVHRF